MVLTKKERLINALRCKPVDRTAFTCADTIITGKIGNPSFVQGDNYTRPEWAMDQLIEGAKRLDMDNFPSFEYAAGMNMMFTDGAENLTPGKELPPDVGTQVIEHNYMTDISYYDYILKNGWNAFNDNFIAIHRTKEDMDEFEKMNELNEIFADKCAEAKIDGYDIYSQLALLDSSAYLLSMQRGFTEFLKDLRRIPDKVEEVMKIMDDDLISNTKKMLGDDKALLGAATLARVDNTSMSKKMFERFVWPSILRCEEAAKKEGMIFCIHADGIFDDDIDLLSELTPGNTTVQHDGFTSYEKLGPAYKDKISMWGDVPAGMLVLDTPDNVYSYCMRLKDLFGDGLILTAGCSFPPNTNLDNVWAMKKASEAK